MLPGPFPTKADPELLRYCANKIADRMLPARGDHIVLRAILLQHEPHRFHVIAGMAPIPPGVKVSEIKAVLCAQLNARKSADYLARDKCLATHGRLMVKKNAAASVNAVRFSIARSDPVSIKLGNAIWRARIDSRGLTLWNFLRLAEHF